MTTIADRMRYHIAIRGGPVKDDGGNFIGTTWPMMLEAADEIDRLRAAIRVNGLRWGFTDAEIDAVLNQQKWET
jgi:hypothetical protein